MGEALFAANAQNPMNKLFASAFSVLLLAGVVHGAAAGGEAGSVVLPEDLMPQLRPLLEQAMRQAPRMLEKNLDLEQSRADGYMARSGSLPSIGGSGQYQMQREKRLDSPDGKTSQNEKYYYNFAINQPLWHWGALEAARKISRIDRELALMNYDEAYRSLATEVRSSYLGLVLSKIAVRNADHVQRMAQENLNRQQARYSANQITYGQIMQDQLRLDETALAARRARADLGFALGTFRSLIGDANFSEADIPDVIVDSKQAPAVASVVASSAIDDSEAIRSAEKEVEKAKLGLIGPRFNLYPKLGLMAGVSRDEITRDIVQNIKYQVDTLYVGAQVNWTVFDGFSTRGQKLAAYTRLRRAERKLASLREDKARFMERERANVGFTWDDYQLTLVRLRMAREGFSHVQDEAARGQASQAQVDLAQTDLNSATYYSQAALAGHLNANAQYLSAQGLDPLGKSAVQH